MKNIKNKLIYDVGFNHGEDTKHYLREKYKVIAIEANPELYREGVKAFKREISSKKLILLNIGIADHEGVQKFWVNELNDEWSAFDKRVGCRNGTACYSINVKTKKLADILNKYGVPHYIKIDIEGNDIYCIQDLSPETSPKYISIEAHKLEYLAILYNLGYRKFKCIDQTNHNKSKIYDNEKILDPQKLRNFINSLINYPFVNFPNWIKYPPAKYTKIRSLLNIDETDMKFSGGSSGPFGEDSLGKWKNLEEVAYNWLHYKNGYKNRGSLNMRGWFDFHAKK